MPAKRTQAQDAPRAPRLPGISDNPAENYHRFFVPAIGEPLADDLVRRAGLRPGERVLDIACGTGVVALKAAEAVGPSGTVTALDINPGMLAVARTATPSRVSVEWVAGDAQSMDLASGAFDVVLCQLGLQLVQDRAGALRQMHRVLAPGGRLLANVPAEAGAVFAVLERALARHLDPPAADFVRTVFSMTDPVAIETSLGTAGYQDVAVARSTWRLRLPPPREFLWQYLFGTPLAPIAAKATEAQRDALERDVAAGCRPFTSATEGMLYEQDVFVATARKA